MSWLPGFEFDVFISYARVDDITADGPDESGWVAQFHRHLDVALAKKVGRLNTVKIWRDVRQIGGNQLFDQTIKDAIQGSALFVALTSNGYLASDYCREELRRFVQKAKQEPSGLALGDDSRIFNVLLNNVAHAAWPPEYPRAGGFPFNDAADPDQAGEPVDPSSEVFRTHLRALTEAVYKTLCRFKEPGPARDASRADAPGHFRVYVADTADTLSSVRKRVVNELRQSPDVRLAAGVPPPFEAAEHDTAAAAEIEAADLSVHLLDAFPGREIVGQEASSYPQRQVELALAHGKSPLILVPQGVTPESIEDAGYAAFLDQLENGPRRQSAYHFQRELPSVMTRQVLSMVDQLKAQRASPPPASLGATLLDTHVKDQLYAFELGQYLIKRHVETFINPQEDNPAANITSFTERLKKVGILVVFYGAVPWEWVRERVSIALHIAVSEGCPLRACGVYVAPPRKPDADRKFSPPFLALEWMDHTGGFNPVAVDRLLARAKAAEAPGG